MKVAALALLLGSVAASAAADGVGSTCAPAAASALVTSGAAADESGLRAADREHARILVEQDAAAQRELIHPNFVQNGPTARVLRRRQAVDRLTMDAPPVDRFERSVEGVTITADVGVVTGGEILSASPGAPDTGLDPRSVVERRFTNVYLYEGGRWRMIARQVTPVAVTTPPSTTTKLGAAPPGARRDDGLGGR